MSVAELANREAIKPFVTFVRVGVEDKKASLEAGRYIEKDVDMVHITAAYSRDIFKNKAKVWLDQITLEGRFPPEWIEGWKKQYEMFKRGQEMPLEGTPIKGWGVISPALQNTLIAMNCLTVETLAAMNDEGMVRLGMGSQELKNKANAWLAQLNDKGALTIKMSALQKENNDLKLSVENLVKQVNALSAAVQHSSPVAVEVREPASGSIAISDIIEDDGKSEIEALRAEYLAKTGKQPHHLWKLSTLKEKLAE